MSRAVYQRRTVTCLATLTESDCTVVLQQKCDNATLIIFISTTTLLLLLPSLQLCSANRTHQLYSSRLYTPLDARLLCVPRGCDGSLELPAAVRPERFFNRHLPSRTRDFFAARCYT